VTILSDRWKGFRRIPHVPIAQLPTELTPLTSLSERAGADLWVKRDDRTWPRYGGNKIRKLEYLLGEVLRDDADTIITTGAAGSHHALATALCAADLRLRVEIIAFPQPHSAHAEAQLRALLHAGAQVHPIRTGALAIPSMHALAARLRLRRRRPFVIPPGGSSVAGVFGYVEAGLELARQIESRVMPEPDAIFVALGTGGTVAGLAIGLAAAGITSEVVGVRVVPRVVANLAVVGSLVKRAVEELRAMDSRFPDVAKTARSHISIETRELGSGYGHITTVSRNAMRLAREHAGMELDPTYTAKALSGMLRHAAGERRGQCLLFLNTLSEKLPESEPGPRLPESLRRLLKR